MTMGDAFGPGERQPQLYGVGGWLLFLCILLMVVGPIQLGLMLFVIARSIAPADSVIAFVPIILLLGIQGLGVLAGILLYRERPLGLRLAKVWCGLGVLFGLIAIAPNPV